LDASEFPSDVIGTFFQNGPGLFERGTERIIHPFDADGMVKAVTFLGPSEEGRKGNRAWFRNRFVSTRGFKQEQAAGRLLYRGVFGTAKNHGAWWSNVGDMRMKNVANTNVLFTDHNQHLYALWEAGRPYELNPVTLQTIQESQNFGNRYSAHYKIDPARKRLCNFCVYLRKSNPAKMHELVVMESDCEAGQELYRQSYVLPGVGIGHDMAITSNWFVFFRFPCNFDPVPYVMGRRGPAQCFTWNDAAASSTIHLIPRGGRGVVQAKETSPIAINIQPCFCFHVCNAFEEESATQLVVDVVVADRMFMGEAGSSHYPDKPIMETMDWSNNGPPPFQLERFVIDISERRVISQTSLSVLPSENRPPTSQQPASATVDFPVIHPDYVGKPYRYAYLGGCASPSVVGPLQGLLKVDVQMGCVVEKWLPCPHEFLSEVAVIPRRHSMSQSVTSSPSSSRSDRLEDDAYLLGYLVNGRDRTSELVLFDASCISNGPISRAPLRSMIPHALHGTFVEGFAPPLTDLVARSFNEG
jgi:all-trans-8'-apo-beta-carotenal 15,15'-oxygenase